MIEGWVVLETINYEHQAEIIRSQLESVGIDCMIFSQKDHVNVLFVGDLSEIKILVKQEDLSKAQEVLKDLELPDMELPEDTEVGELQEEDWDEEFNEEFDEDEDDEECDEEEDESEDRPKSV